ncbi:MAG TPA: hypothetical protein VG347_24870, partial [Verrucomicrobiae bacterium]|nr:hypothetical protein [Verrucomicrobiae bacterium]
TNNTTKPLPPVFQKAAHEPRPKAEAAADPKKGRASSQSRDTREDRGARQAKTAHNVQTLPHGR